MDEFKDASPLPWTVDESGAILDANGEQVGSLMPARRAQNAALVTRTVGAFEPMRDAISAAAVWIWDPDGDVLEIFERIAEEFHRDTGYLRPGKSEPMEMCYQGRDEERQRAWDKWRTDRARKVLEDLRAALRAADGESER